jgi:titin
MTGLTNGQTYTFTVTATNSVGTSAASTASLAVTPLTAPDAVSGLVATAGNGQVVLSWVSPGAGGLGGGTFVSYTIYKKLHSAGSYSGTADITDTASVNDTSATITGLTNGTAYDFKVLINATGGSAQASDYTAYANLIPAAAPNAPTLTISYASSTSATVTWVGGNSNGSAITGYTLSYTLNGSSTSCSGGNTTTAAGSSCTITGAAGDDFGASAYATNLIGNSTTASASFTLIGTAAAPASLVGTAGDGSATITFTEDNNGDPISDYLYSLDGGVSFISSGSKSSPITITGLTNGTPVSIIIQAVGAVNGASASSTSVTVTPAAPAASGGGGSTVTVTTTIDRTTTSSQSPIVQKGIDAISNHKDVDQYFKSPTTISNQPTGTTITTSNIQSINSTTAVNTQVVTTTSNKQAVVTISLTAPIITDQAVAALATKITVVSTQTGLTVTPVAGFTGVLVVPVIATVNGVQTTVLNKVVVNPVAPAPQGFAPTDIGKSSVAWTASTSQVTSYQVAINGKAAGTTTASTIALPSLIGPKSKVTVTAMGNDQTASTPIVIPYVAKAPIPALKVNFISGSAVLTPAQKADISSIAKVIDTQGFTRLVVNGFTDAVGSPAANAVLSQARAQAVVAYMKTILPKVAVKAGANGSANPVADNTTPTGQAQNRRTEIATW